jgi:hypothetical protein
VVYRGEKRIISRKRGVGSIEEGGVEREDEGDEMEDVGGEGKENGEGTGSDEEDIKSFHDDP